MIKILIITDRITRWYHTIINMMEVDITIQRKEYTEIRNKLFTFHIQSGFPESRRGAAYAHVILDKQLDEKTFYEVLMPTIKQRITSYGLDKLLNN